MATATAPLGVDAAWAQLLRESRAPSLRGLEQWAAEEFVIPKGEYRGERLRYDRQPYARLLYREIDANKWPRVVTPGCVQSGKTQHTFVIPLMHSLFELQEDTGAGFPDLVMAADKWRLELLPAIKANYKFKALLPEVGRGSRGGTAFDSVQLRHGPTLKLMSGSGGDEQRSGFTGRTIAMTEVDKSDTAKESSRESDPITQMENRASSYTASRRRIFMECTVSIEQGRVWREYTSGTASRICCPCPHCGEYVSPEREHLRGWQDAKSKTAAASASHFVCPACDHAITDSERRDMNVNAVLAHRGQEVDKDGFVHGPLPETDTLGFRWSAFNNLFWSSGDIGAKEWNARYVSRSEEAEKELRQFYWVLPYDPPEVTMTPLRPEDVSGRTSVTKKGIVPSDTEAVAVGIDTGKRQLNWVALALNKHGGGTVIDYGEQTVEADRIGVRAGLVEALARLKVYFTGGWPDLSGLLHSPGQVWIDSGYFEHTDAVYEFCLEANTGLTIGSACYRPAKGYGVDQQFSTRYATPREVNHEVRWIGDEYHLSVLPRAQQYLVHVNADHWKSQLHQRLAMPPDQPLAIVLYDPADRVEHFDYTEQLTAEEQREIIDSRGRPAIVWKRIRRKNHKLDATYMALTAGCFMLETQRVAGEQSAHTDGRRDSVVTPDGRPYFVLER